MNLPDMDERSMPDQPGLTWRRAHLGVDPAFADFIRGFEQGFKVTVDDRSPIRVQAEVGRPLDEIES